MLKLERWQAIAGALVLLLAADTLLSPEPATATDRGALRERIADELQKRRPRLGPYRAERIASAVLRCEVHHDLAPDLVLAIMEKESSYRPGARSPKGALGLMQVMPYMFEQLEVPGHAAHIEVNAEAGCLLLADNIRRLGEEDGISAYFWGNHIRGRGYLEGVRRIRSEWRERLGPAIDRGRG
jgi:hypothetical protein